MKLSIIAAVDENGVIGKNNGLPWKLPRELKYVKEKTMGSSIVLGRKNYESIGMPLPGRRNIVLTRDPSYKAEGCEVIHAMEDLFFLTSGEEEVFIFGGAEIYKIYLPYVDKIYLTRIHHSFKGDTFFPNLDLSMWKEHPPIQGITDEYNPYTYFYHVYER
ncbi:dihydrofolate reductase [Brevibacillus sp. NPDC058079]|uniref:dihydrofolate reductase n=1 Tax=Brevibacillus sp. NPDC058079 TaxID=3346330 RepID=UPI0036E1FDDB